MKISGLKERSGLDQNEKLRNRYSDFERLVDELGKKEIPEEIMISINRDIESVNIFSGSTQEESKQLKKAQSSILKLVEKELKIVPKNHYRKMWLALGMSAFGLPLGVAFGMSLGNMAFLGIGLPIGMAIGIGYGTSLDKKASESGLQLDVEIKQ